jgi:hypothetical protein
MMADRMTIKTVLVHQRDVAAYCILQGCRLVGTEQQGRWTYFRFDDSTGQTTHCMDVWSAGMARVEPRAYNAVVRDLVRGNIQ